MSQHTDGKAILKELVDGLKGVSTGNWEAETTKTENDEGHYTSYMLMDDGGYTIADAINASSTEIVFESAGECEGDGDVIDLLASANFKHLARCSPSNIRAIAEYVAKLEAEKDALKHDIERHLKITSEQATENERLTVERDTALARVAELEALANTALDELHQLKNTFNFSRMIMDADRRVAAGEIIDDVQAFIMKSRVALSPKEGG